MEQSFQKMTRWLNGGWKRSLGRHGSHFRDQHQYERTICKKGNFRWMTHLVLISGTGNDSWQSEPVGHFPSSHSTLKRECPDRSSLGEPRPLERCGCPGAPEV